MSRLATPARIGLFVLLGLFLATATIIYVGSTRFWEKDQIVVIYFRESVNGLSVGSPVKFKGVPIGAVADIRLNYNQDMSVEGFYIPVFVRIRESRVRAPEGGVNYIDLTDQEEILRHIEGGLRARLELESIISGQLYVELDYYAEPEASYTLIQEERRYPEIPSLPSVMTELGSSATEVFAQLGALDVETISNELVRLLRQANDSLEAMDVAAWNAAILGASEGLQSALDQLQFEPTIERLNRVLETLARMTEEMEGTLPGAVEDVRVVATELAGALERSRTVLDNLETITAPDAAIQRELLRTMRDLSRAAQSARELMNYLERNPSALLRGRGETR